MIIVFIKAIFSAAETACTYLNKSKISQLSKSGDKKAIKIKAMLDNGAKFYGTIETVIIMIELFASAFAAEVFVNSIAYKLISNYNMEIGLAYTISIIIITIVLSYILLVFGAILPKKIGRNFPEKVARKTINIVWFVSKLNYPFEKIIKFSEKFFSKIFGIKNEKQEKLTEQEIKMIILEGKDQGIIDKDEKDLLINALRFDHLIIKDIMISKEKISLININMDMEEILSIFTESKYTRIPVYEKSKDNIIGILNIKNLTLEKSKNKKVEINKILSDPLFISKNEKIDIILKIMQTNNKHMAIVKDNDKVLGLVTLEDILEKLVGTILDEFNR